MCSSDLFPILEPVTLNCGVFTTDNQQLPFCPHLSVTYSKTTYNVTTYGITTYGITTYGITTYDITTYDIQYNNIQHNNINQPPTE